MPKSKQLAGFDPSPILHANILREWCAQFWADTLFRGAQLIRLNYGRQKLTLVTAQQRDGVWKAHCLNRNAYPVEGVGLGLTESESVVALAAAHYAIMVSKRN